MKKCVCAFLVFALVGITVGILSIWIRSGAQSHQVVQLQLLNRSLKDILPPAQGNHVTVNLRELPRGLSEDDVAEIAKIVGRIPDVEYEILYIRPSFTNMSSWFVGIPDYEVEFMRLRDRWKPVMLLKCLRSF